MFESWQGKRSHPRNVHSGCGNHPGGILPRVKSQIVRITACMSRVSGLRMNGDIHSLSLYGVMWAQLSFCPALEGTDSVVKCVHASSQAQFRTVASNTAPSCALTSSLFVLSFSHSVVCLTQVHRLFQSEILLSFSNPSVFSFL